MGCYAPRAADATVLHGVVREHLDDFLTAAESFLGEARRLDPACTLLERAERVLRMATPKRSSGA